MTSSKQRLRHQPSDRSQTPKSFLHHDVTTESISLHISGSPEGLQHFLDLSHTVAKCFYPECSIVYSSQNSTHYQSKSSKYLSLTSTSSSSSSSTLLSNSSTSTVLQTSPSSPPSSTSTSENYRNREDNFKQNSEDDIVTSGDINVFQSSLHSSQPITRGKLIQDISTLSNKTNIESKPSNPKVYPSFSLSIFLRHLDADPSERLKPNATPRDKRASSLLKAFKSLPWKLHHVEQLEGLKSNGNSKHSFEHYQISEQLPTWCVRRTRNPKEHLRIVLHTSHDIWDDQVTFYSLVLGVDHDALREDFCLFTVQKENGLDYAVQFALKRVQIDNGSSVINLPNIHLQIPIKDLGRVIALLPNICQPISDDLWETEDHAGNKIVFKVLRNRQQNRRASLSLDEVVYECMTSPVMQKLRANSRRAITPTILTKSNCVNCVHTDEKGKNYCDRPKSTTCCDSQFDNDNNDNKIDNNHNIIYVNYFDNGSTDTYANCNVHPSLCNRKPDIPTINDTNIRNDQICNIRQLENHISCKKHRKSASFQIDKRTRTKSFICKIDSEEQRLDIEMCYENQSIDNSYNEICENGNKLHEKLLPESKSSSKENSSDKNSIKKDENLSRFPDFKDDINENKEEPSKRMSDLDEFGVVGDDEYDTIKEFCYPQINGSSSFARVINASTSDTVWKSQQEDEESLTLTNLSEESGIIILQDDDGIWCEGDNDDENNNKNESNDVKRDGYDKREPYYGRNEETKNDRSKNKIIRPCIRKQSSRRLSHSSSSSQSKHNQFKNTRKVRFSDEIEAFEDDSQSRLSSGFESDDQSDGDIEPKTVKFVDNSISYTKGQSCQIQTSTKPALYNSSGFEELITQFQHKKVTHSENRDVRFQGMNSNCYSSGNLKGLGIQNKDNEDTYLSMEVSTNSGNTNSVRIDDAKLKPPSYRPPQPPSYEDALAIKRKRQIEMEEREKLSNGNKDATVNFTLRFDTTPMTGGQPRKEQVGFYV